MTRKAYPLATLLAIFAIQSATAQSSHVQNASQASHDTVHVATKSLKNKNVDDTTLDDVVLTKSKNKPYIQRKDGKTILNIESSIALSGSSAFDIVEKSPGVKVDANDQIIYKGQGNVIIQIDGKNTSMSGTELANYLKGISSQSIENLEFISNPSAKYDAAGSSIINIVMKKNTKKGTNGSFKTMIGTGKLFNNANSIHLNHSSNKVNYYLNYAFNYRRSFSNLILKRDFYASPNNIEKTLQQDNYIQLENRTHNAKVGLDYKLNDKNNIGLSLGFIGNNFSADGENEALAYNHLQQLDYTFNTDSRSRNNYQTTSYNINHLMKLDDQSSVWSTDLDYIRSRNSSLQSFTTELYPILSQQNSSTESLFGDLNGSLDIYSLKSDVKKILNNQWTAEFGLKTSMVKADNDLAFYDTTNGQNIIDYSRTNHYNYKESIIAGFASAQKKWTKWSTTMGLRLEHTHVHGLQKATQTENKNSYTQWFPNLQIQYNLNSDHTFDLSYSKRISRPTYTDLNPFKFYADPTTYKAGNPDLKPQISDNIEFNYTFKNKYILSLSYNRVSDNITTVLKPTVENGQNVTIQLPENLRLAKFFNVQLSVPVKLFNWWNINNQIYLQYGTYSGDVSNTIIHNLGNTTVLYNMLNQFRLTKNIQAEVTANYQSREVYAFMDIRPRFDVNVGIQTKLGKNHALKLNLNNLFFRPHIVAKNTYNNYIENFRVVRDTRQILLTYTYNFGGKTQSNRKTGGAEDLQNRIKNG